MKNRASNQADCYPSGTQSITLKYSAIADYLKRFSYLAPAHARQTDT